VLKFRDGTKQSDKQFINSFESTSNQPTSWLVHYWSTIGVRTSHGRPRTYKTHHNPNSGEATTFPHIIFFAPLCEVYIQMTLGGVLKLLRFGLLQFCGTKTPRSNLQLIWSLKQSCSYRQKLSKSVSHATSTHGVGSIPDFLWSAKWTIFTNEGKSTDIIVNLIHFYGSTMK
jgi:hypothetical protein